MLSLKIDNQFIALPEETEISIEASNPIFSDAGAKTYLFEIPVESLRHIIGNADEIYGESLYDTLEGKRAEIYIDGVQFFSGVVNLEDSISIEDGKIAVSIASGNLEFAQMIEGMNCRDVEQAEEVVVGERYINVEFDFTVKAGYNVMPSEGTTLDFDFELPDEFVITRRGYYNVSEEYPNKKYCNIRCACTSPNGWKVDEYRKDDYTAMVSTEIHDRGDSYYGLDACRRNSGICFYVRYFLDCLAKTLGLSFSTEIFDKIRDFNRLAFVNMRCRVTSEGYRTTGEMLDEQEFDLGFTRSIPGVNFSISEKSLDLYDIHAWCWKKPAVATSENFPDVDVSDVMDALYSAFGVKAVCDSKTNEVEFIFIKDVLKSQEVVDIYSQVYSANKVHNRRVGFRLSYDTDEEDTNYNMPYIGSYEVKNDYKSILKEVRAFNKTIYIDSRNGNAYAIKVDEEADSNGDEKNLNPSLFEVGAFAKVEYGSCENDEVVEEIKIPFIPIINFDIEGKENKEKAESVGDDELENKYALLLDEDVEPAKKKYYRSFRNFNFTGDTSLGQPVFTSHTPFMHFSYYDYLGSNSDVSTSENWHPATEETKVNAYDVGFMLGIMRGPGSESSLSAFEQNFDGEGNYRVAYTSANYAFTADSIDNCDRDFDYNGTGEGIGGDDAEGRISLKIHAGKYDKDGNPIPIDKGVRAERGLYDKFWKEYAYFTVNKKIVRITCGMEIADIANIDWTKRYHIGEWTGFIANYSYNVNKNGISEVELEMYYV